MKEFGMITGEGGPAGRGPLAPLGPELGLVSSMAAFSGRSGIENQGLGTEIIGDAGTPGASTLVTGFHNAALEYDETSLNRGAITGLVHTAGPQGTPARLAHATKVAAAALAVFHDLASRSGTMLGAGQLGGLTLAAGVYQSPLGSFLLTGLELTLDGLGDPNAVWIFQMATDLMVGDHHRSQSVILKNGALARNVFWQVGGSASINPAGGGSMVGTILAQGDVAFSKPGNQVVTVLNGRAISLSGLITTVNTVINASDTLSVAPRGVPSPQVVVLGPQASAVIPLVVGPGFLNILNSGGLVIATQNGPGTITLINNGGSVTALNVGSGLMSIRNDATGSVTVSNEGNGKVTVHTTGASAISISHTGDDDFFFPS